MLTKSEREWLERREEMPGYYCMWCPLWDNEADCDGRSPHPFCPIFQRRERLWDAAEFAERVAVKLATNENCGVDEDCPPNMPFGWGKLKAARLAVEEEMDEAD